MKIEVLRTNHNTGVLNHPSDLAWRLSRPNNEPIPLDKILSLDLPVNEIPMTTLFIESTILEREIITTLRNHVMWAQTSRVQDILKFTYPEELFEHVGYFEEQRTKMTVEEDMGIRQDSYRKNLPIMSLTKYTINLSMRDMIHLLKFFNDLGKRIGHLSKLCVSADNAFYDILTSVFGITSQNIASYKQRPILHPIRTPQSGVVGDTLVINTSLSLSLRAQLVRHRALHIQDNLLDLMANKSIITSDIDTEVEVQVSGLISDWTEIIRKRSCWIAQYDLWKDLLDKAEQHLKLGVSGLPCHDGTCPFDGDAKARYTNEDPNAPCPIHAKLTKSSLSTSNLIECQTQYELDKRPKFWQKEIDGFCHGEAL